MMRRIKTKVRNNQYGTEYASEESTDFVKSHVNSFFPLDEELKKEKTTKKHETAIHEDIVDLIPVNPPEVSELGELRDVSKEVSWKTVMREVTETVSNWNPLLGWVMKTVTDYVEETVKVVDWIAEKGLEYIQDPRQALRDASNFVHNVIEAGENFVEHALEELGKAAMSAWENAKAGLDKIADALNALVDYVLGKVKQIFMPVYNKVLGGLSDLKNSFIDAMNKAYDSILNGTGKAGKFLTDVVLSGYFFSAVLGLVLAFQTISTILSIYSMGGAAALAGKAVSMITVELARDLFKHAVASGIALGGIATISALLYIFKPKDDPFWGEGIGLASINLGVILWKTSIILFSSDATGVLLETLGLVWAFFGLFLASVQNPSTDIVIGSLLISAIGLVTTVANRDIYDKLPIAPLKNIEEILSLLIFLYAMASTGRELS